jgi:hypothetical protein
MEVQGRVTLQFMVMQLRDLNRVFVDKQQIVCGVIVFSIVLL